MCCLSMQVSENLPPIEYVDENHFNELFSMLVKGTFFTVQQILPLIPEGGTIILNTSIVTNGNPQFFCIFGCKSGGAIIDQNNCCRMYVKGNQGKRCESRIH